MLSLLAYPYSSHDCTIRCRSVSVLVLVVTLMSSSLAPLVDIVPMMPVQMHVVILLKPIAVEYWPIRGYRWAKCCRPIWTCEPMIRSKALVYMARGNHRASNGTGSNCRSCQSTCHDLRIAPLTWNCMVSSDVVSNHLVTAPGSLHHFNRLLVCEAAVACRTCVRRCNQSLIDLAVGTVEKISEEAAGLAHRNPGVTACW